MEMTNNKPQVPTLEPARQFYFMDLLREHNEKKSAELGRKLTYHIETFGCPMVIVTQKCGNPLFI